MFWIVKYILYNKIIYKLASYSFIMIEFHELDLGYKVKILSGD